MLGNSGGSHGGGIDGRGRGYQRNGHWFIRRRRRIPGGRKECGAPLLNCYKARYDAPSTIPRQRGNSFEKRRGSVPFLLLGPSEHSCRKGRMKYRSRGADRHGRTIKRRILHRKSQPHILSVSVLAYFNTLYPLKHQQPCPKYFLYFICFKAPNFEAILDILRTF